MAQRRMEQTPQQKIDDAVGRVAQTRGTLALSIRDAVPQIERRLPSFLAKGTAERYAAIALSTVQASPGLARCTPASIVRGVVRAAEYGLALDGVMGHAYLVPYKIKGVDTAQFQIGYRGLVELMYRTGFWASVNANVVREGDFFDYDEGTSSFLKHKRTFGQRGDMYAVYAIAHPTNGGPATFKILDEDQVLHHRAASKAYSYKPAESIWEMHPETAWCKSALRELSKSVAMATDKHSALRKAAILDEQIDRGEVVDADGETVTAEIVPMTNPPAAPATTGAHDDGDECPADQAVVWDGDE